MEPVYLHRLHIPYMNNYRVLTLVNLLLFAAMGFNLPLLTLYLQELGADFALISLILTSTILVTLAGSPAWGWLADRLRRRKLLYIVALVGVGCAYWWLSRATGVFAAWPARLLDALCMAGTSTLGLTLMGDTLERSERKGRKMGFSRGLGSLAFAAGALVGGRLADALGLATMYQVCSGLLFAAAVTALLLQDVTPERGSVSGRAVVLGRPRLGLPLLFLTGVVLWTMAHVASTSMWPNYMASQGYSKTAISSLWSLAALIEMPAMFLGGALSDVVGRATVLAAGGAGIVLVQLGYLLLSASLPALLGVQVVRGFGFGSYTSASMTYAAEAGGQEQRSSSSALFYTAGSVGQLAGNLLGGMLVQLAGFHLLLWVCAGLAVCGTGCFWLLRRRGDLHLAGHSSTP
ncbi:MAG: MFS transporter [Caldilinea sp.]|jgi:MFS family permease